MPGLLQKSLKGLTPRGGLSMPKCSGVTTRVVHAVRSRSSRGSSHEPPASLPVSVKEPFWRDLFETISVSDSWSLPIIGEMHWELMHPITTEDVVRALKKIKDDAPGPDGRKLADVKTISADELAGHFNLWLLAGCLPGRLRRGQSVLLPK